MGPEWKPLTEPGSTDQQVQLEWAKVWGLSTAGPTDHSEIGFQSLPGLGKKLMYIRASPCLKGCKPGTVVPSGLLPLANSRQQYYNQRFYATSIKGSTSSIAEKTDELSNQSMRQGSYERELVQKQVSGVKGRYHAPEFTSMCRFINYRLVSLKKVSLALHRFCRPQRQRCMTLLLLGLDLPACF